MEAFQKGIGTSAFLEQLFTATSGEIEFIADVNEAKRLDDMYFFYFSGDKIANALLNKIDPVEDVNYLVHMFWDAYGLQLNRQWENFTATYDPTSNYHVTEDVDYTHTGENQGHDSGTDSSVRTGSVAESGKTESTTQIAPYDTDYQNKSKSTTTVGVNNNPMTTTYNNVTDTTTYGKGRRNSESSIDVLQTRKAGNLGVTPIAQLLEMDIELWKKNFYTTILFPTLDKFLAVSIYPSI